MSRLIVVGAAVGAVLAAAPGTAGIVSSDHAGVDRLSRAFDEAQFHRNVAAIDALLAPDMVYIRGSGERVGREAFLANFSDPDERFEPFHIVDRKLVTLGRDVVAVTGEATIRGQAAGKPLADHFRYTDIFGKRQGRWWVVFVQVSRIVQP